MKLYFAYRTGYEPNLRYIKEFESDSIFDWFISNWETLTNDNYSELLGTIVYGFPIRVEPKAKPKPKKQSFFDKIFGKKQTVEPIDNTEIEKPKNFEELLEFLINGLYSNEIEGNQHCIKVATDDDEIELAYFVFDDLYKTKNEEKLAIWFNPELPTKFGTVGKELKTNFPKISVKGNSEGCTYFLSSPIYDGSNLEDMTVIKIDGVRVDGIINYLKNNELEEIEGVLYPIDELNYIKKIANELKTGDLRTILDVFAKYPITELQDIEVNEQSLNEIKEKDFNNLPEKSIVNISEHLVEISVNSIEIFYNYYMIFDDLWIEKNEVLAESISYFGSNWDS